METGNELSPSRKLKRFLPALLPPLLAFLVFSPSITSGFSLWDDQVQIVLNPFVRSHLPLPRQLLNLFRRDVSSFVTVRGTGNYYRPFMQLAYWAEYRLWGLTGWAFHLVSLLLNSLVAFLAFLVLKELLAGRRPRESEASATAWAACAGATLFAVHPLHAEPVAWLAALPELQFSASYLLALWLYLRGIGGPGRRRGFWILQIAGAALLAYLCKEMAVTLPLVVGMHLCLGARWPWNRRAILLRCSLLAPFVLMAISYFGIRQWALGGRLGLGRPEVASWKPTLLSALTLCGRYWAKIVFPYPLSLAYPFRPTDSLAEPFLWLGLATVVAAVWLFLKRFRLAAMGILWVGVTLLPALNIRNVGDELPIADRYAYLPSLGLSVLVAAACLRVVRLSPKIRWGFAGVFAVLLLFFAGLSGVRAQQWNNQIELYSQAVERAPAYWLYTVWGNTLLAEERWEESLVPFRKALEVGRGRTVRSDAHNGMSFAYFKMGNLDRAKGELERALLINPDSQYARYNLALVHRQLGDLAEAMNEVKVSLRLNPYSIEANLLAGQIAQAQGDRETARRYFAITLRLDPNNAEARQGFRDVFKQP